LPAKLAERGIEDVPGREQGWSIPAALRSSIVTEVYDLESAVVMLWSRCFQTAARRPSTSPRRHAAFADG
jgi:hypothetical protein